MKKTLTASIMSALVIGVASTTFAAANPFSDVPADHWSFDAVAKLAQEGVIEGYADNTFRGDAKITRYEMAQMVAKAMAKEDVSAADKTTIDKLAAEYADELNNLGVRVANLEKKSDNVKFDGMARYRYNNTEVDGKDDVKNNEALLRLNVTAQINDNWVAKARIEGKHNLDNNDDGAKNSSFDTNRVYVQGPLFGSTATLGKLPTYSAQGLIMDDLVSGAEFNWKNGAVTVMATAGRLDEKAITGTAVANNAADYQAIEFGYQATDKIGLIAGYNRVAEKNIIANEDSIGIWSVGGTYKFNNDLSLSGIYAQSDADTYEKAGSVELTYKGANAKQAGSYGAFVAYRHLGNNAVVVPTFDAISKDQKGIELGFNYAFDKNIVGTVKYFDGEVLTTEKDAKKLFTQVEFKF